MSHKIEIDPKLDLVLERIIDVPRSLVWEAWTTPDHLKHWFVPTPCSVELCEIDLEPGGKFRTVIKLPDGNSMDSSGCYLQIKENELLVWTDGLLPGFRPKAESFMTAHLILEDEGEGTKYRAIVQHKDEDDLRKHEEMGFMDGWGTVVDQLAEYIKKNMM